MAIVQRRYALIGPPLTELPRIVPGANTIAFSGVFAVIEFDNAVAGITETLDEYMAQIGFVQDGDAGKNIKLRAADDTLKPFAVNGDVHLLHVAKNGSDVDGTGAPMLPFATIQKALDTIGTAADAAEFNDDDKARYKIIVHPGVYTEALAIPTRQVVQIVLDGAKIVGNVIYVMDGAVMNGVVQQTKLIISGNDLRNAYDLASLPMASAVVGDILVSQVGGTASLNFCQTHLINAGVRGNIRSTGAVAFTHQVFAENAILDAGDFIIDVGAGAGTLYCANSDTSSTHSWGGIQGAITLNVLRNVRFTRPVIPTGAAAGRWFGVEFRAGQAHDFSGVTGGGFSADTNSFASYFTNVPTKGPETFTILDKLSGTTAARPTATLPSPANDGVMYYDTTLAFPIFRKGASLTGWINALGVDS